MYPFSICIIAKNEEKDLEKFLSSLINFNCEILLVDTGSTDKTVEIAQKYKIRVLLFEWINDFSAARNYSISQASFDWILVLDCDEFVEEANPELFLKMGEECPQYVGLLKRINLAYPDSQKESYIDMVPRFFNRKYFHYEGTIHEQVRSISQKPIKGYYLPLTVIHTGYSGTPEQKEAKHIRNLTMLQKELETAPDNPYLHFQIGQEYYNQSEWVLALPHLKQVLSKELISGLEFHRLAVMAYGDCLMHLNRLEEAQQLSIYADTFGYSPDFHCLMGMIYYAAGNALKAMSEFIIATSMNNPFKEGTNTYVPFFYMGLINESLGNPEAAHTFYEKCGDYAPALERLTSL